MWLGFEISFFFCSLQSCCRMVASRHEEMTNVHSATTCRWVCQWWSTCSTGKKDWKSNLTMAKWPLKRRWYFFFSILFINIPSHFHAHKSASLITHQRQTEQHHNNPHFFSEEIWKWCDKWRNAFAWCERSCSRPVFIRIYLQTCPVSPLWNAEFRSTHIKTAPSSRLCRGP